MSPISYGINSIRKIYDTELNIERELIAS